MRPFIYIYWRVWAFYRGWCPKHFIDLWANDANGSCGQCWEKAREHKASQWHKEPAKAAWFRKRLQRSAR